MYDHGNIYSYYINFMSSYQHTPLLCSIKATMRDKILYFL